MNPAVSAGICMARFVPLALGKPEPITTLIALSIFEILGAVNASVVFAMTHAQECSYATTFSRISDYFAEFVGIFVLVFTVGRCVLTGSTTWNATPCVAGS